MVERAVLAIASAHARVGNAWSIAHEGRLESDPHENMAHARRRAGDEHLGIVPPRPIDEAA